MSAYKPRFTIFVDGVRVEGEITSRWARDIEVRLVSPIGHLSSSCSVPWFAARFADYSGPQGDSVARQLLEELYRKALLFDCYRETLRLLLRELYEKLANLDRDDTDSPDAIREERRLLRRRFRAGELDERTYQRKGRALKARARAHDERRSGIEDEFMNNPPWPDYVDMGQVAMFIRESERAPRIRAVTLLAYSRGSR